MPLGDVELYRSDTSFYGAEGSGTLKGLYRLSICWNSQGNLVSISWTLKVCKIMAFMAILGSLGLLFHILLGFRIYNPYSALQATGRLQFSTCELPIRSPDPPSSVISYPNHFDHTICGPPFLGHLAISPRLLPTKHPVLSRPQVPTFTYAGLMDNLGGGGAEVCG